MALRGSTPRSDAMSNNKYVAHFLKTRAGGKQPASTSKVQPIVHDRRTEVLKASASEEVTVPEGPTVEIKKEVGPRVLSEDPTVEIKKAPKSPPSKQPK